LTYQPVKGLGAPAAGAVCEFVTSAARTAPKEDAKTAQVETQVRNKIVGLLEPTITAFPIRIGMGSALSKVRRREQMIRRRSEIPSNYEGIGTLMDFASEASVRSPASLMHLFAARG
jgi:hypothetical protein